MGDKKSDMERVGLFQEMEYATIGDKYKSPGICKYKHNCNTVKHTSKNLIMWHVMYLNNSLK